MSTTVALNAAASGLNVAQSMLDTISNNISNAQTPGYTTETVNPETMVVAGQAIGVQIGAVTTNVNQYLQMELVNQTSANQAASVVNQYLQQLQSFNGPSSAQGSLSGMISSLQSALQALSASPDDPSAQSAVIAAAQQVTSTFNAYSQQIQQLRNNAQSQISTDVTTVNQQLKTIAQLNVQIAAAQAQGQSTAALVDQRNQAVTQVAQYMQVSTFTNSNGVMTVMTQGGQTLADTTAQQLVFQPTQLSAQSFYPGGGAAGLTLGSAGGPAVQLNNLGGEMGALFNLRDQTLPTYQAQLDSAAQQLASNFSSEGLALFTQPNGAVPANTAAPTPAAYTGFAGDIQVNQNIVADPQLLQSGTGAASPPAGSAAVVNNVLQYAFGATSEQQGTGTANISAGTIFGATGLTQINQIVGTQSLTAYGANLSGAPGLALPGTFTIQIGAGLPQTVTINAGDTPADLVSDINTAVGSNVASLSGGGNLVINAPADVAISDGPAGVPPPIGASGIAALGLSFGTFTAQDPSFTVQVGGDNPVTVTISPADTSATLLAQLNAIPGLTATLTGGGGLQLTPTDGGSLSLQNVTGAPLTALGVTVNNVPWAATRQSQLGPGANLSTNLPATGTLTGYISSLLSAQAQDASTASNNATAQGSYLTAVTNQVSNSSGVNIDDQLAQLTSVQTSYEAAAQMLTSTEKLLDNFINSI